MTFAIAAAGTGGHVYPGLAVGEALVDLGVGRDQVLFIGGSRIEATVYPEAGFPFLGVEIRGLQRSLSSKNLGLPRMMWRARDSIRAELDDRRVQVALGLGGYVTIPTALAARAAGVPLMIAEQNAEAGLANRVASRWARRVFVSFPDTLGLAAGEWVGNPVRRALAAFDRSRLRPGALDRYGLSPDLPTLGVFGGSLGAGALNTAADGLVRGWKTSPIQIVHITGRGNLPATGPDGGVVTRRMIEFEEHMEDFYAVSDLVVARSGGGVAELTATRTPSILVPGEFGSSGHQIANARFLRSHGAALVVAQDRIEELPGLVESTLLDDDTLRAMSLAAAHISKPEAAMTIANAMLESSR